MSLPLWGSCRVIKLSSPLQGEVPQEACPALDAGAEGVPRPNSKPGSGLRRDPLTRFAGAPPARGSGLRATLLWERAGVRIPLG